MRCSTKRRLKIVGLFSGIGGIELGFLKAGHQPILLCERDPAARAVLEARFPDTETVFDIRGLKSLPRDTDLVTAGFPCQDLSQAGSANGIRGARSGLVAHVFRLLRGRRVPWVLLENVPFMLWLSGGAAMRYVVARLEDLGYRWAYRLIETRSFGIPQRRQRVFILAALDDDPTEVLLKTTRPPTPGLDYRGQSCGFYWTEGNRGVGWAVNSIPTLKGGSTWGIACPPAIWFPDGRIATPDIRDAERLQGFRPGWTSPAEAVGRRGRRWTLVGNAVTVDIAKWLGERLAVTRAAPNSPIGQELLNGTWPRAAYGSRTGRFAAEISAWPVSRTIPPLDSFLRFPTKPLSLRAATGFEARLSRSNLRTPHEFRRALKKHIRCEQQSISERE